MASHPHLLDDAIRLAPTGPRAATLSSKIVADVRAALGARRLAPGSFLGTENDVAAHWRVSRIVARDALRTLQALGVVEVKVGSGGGARIANSNPDLFADALGVQLDLMGVSAAEALDAQRAIESPDGRTRGRERHPRGPRVAARPAGPLGREPG